MSHVGFWVRDLPLSFVTWIRLPHLNKHTQYICPQEHNTQGRGKDHLYAICHFPSEKKEIKLTK